jgi:hypothetical protein
MTATETKPQSREAILTSQESPWRKAQMLAEFDRQNPPMPTAPPPLTPSERAALKSIKVALEKLSTDFKTLAEREKRFGDELLSAVETLHKVECLPDAADDLILAEFLAERRLQKIRQFLANVSPSRELLVRELGTAFMQVNSILERFTGPKFYPSGAVHFPAITAAIREIEKHLASK